jgi:hypothetical protein
VREIRTLGLMRRGLETDHLNGTAPILDPTCVQRRLAYSVGDSLTRAKVRSPVAWIVRRKETEF